jgi:hypothetical protein
MRVPLVLLVTSGAVVVGTALLLLALSTRPSSALVSPERPLYTAFFDPYVASDPNARIGFKRERAGGASVVRLSLYWDRVAPQGSAPPAGFDPRDPADGHYDWSSFDGQVKSAVAAGLDPLVFIDGAPLWAQRGDKQRPSDGPVNPDPGAFGDFATATAKRYGGDFRGLPRVRYWQVWNEPNLNIQLMPQHVGDRVASPAVYRAMVNAMARAVHNVHRDNVVVAGGLAPFGGDVNDPSGGRVPDQERVHPLEFMRDMLCMSSGAKPEPTCDDKTEFDVWAHHAYTYGGPTHHAFDEDDVSIGDLPSMRRLLDAAAAAGHIRTSQRIGFWVTEFSYDSNPPDPKGLPVALHARWTSESLYRMWQSGVSLVTWFLLRDEAFPGGMFQSGFYFRGADGIASDKPKPSLRAFRFPFVAFRQQGGGIRYWGRTPASVNKRVVVEQAQASRWRRLVSPKVDRFGIFQGRVSNARGNGPLRARLVDRSDRSQPFSLEVPEDFRFCPWGSFC